MGSLLGKLHHLVFDARAVARPDAFDHAGVERRLVEVAADDLVRSSFVCVIQQGICRTWKAPSRQPLSVKISSSPRHDGIREVTEKRRRLIAVLAVALGKIDALGEQAARRAGLEPARLSKPSSRRLSLNVETVSPMRPPVWFFSPTCSSPRMKVPVVTTTERAAETEPEIGFDAGYGIVLDEQAGDIALLEIQMRLALEDGLEAELVAPSCRTGHAGPARWALARIEHAELDTRGVRVQPHHASERIDLAHHVALGQPADGGVARHLADGVGILREQAASRNPAAKPPWPPRCRRGQRR